MKTHEQCIEYIQDRELNFEPGNYYGNLSLKHENGHYYWSVNDCGGRYGNLIPDYLGDALVNYYCEDEC